MASAKRKATVNIALTGILGAAALALSFLESLIPEMPFLPPGAKLGLANIAVMFTVLSVGIPQAFAVAIIKSLFVLITRGAGSFFMSFAGGLLSMAAVSAAVFLQKKLKTEFSYFALSVTGAVFHNIGQLIAAGLYSGTSLVVSYLPALIVFGIAAGCVNGVILRTVMPAILKTKMFS